MVLVPNQRVDLITLFFLLSLLTPSPTLFLLYVSKRHFPPSSLQFTGGCWDVLRDLGELQVGAVHHVGLAAALGRTHWIAVAGIIQTGVLGA